MKDLKTELLIYKNKIEELTAYNNRLKSILLSNKLGEKNIRIAAKTSDRVEFVSIPDIVFCRADSGSSEIHLKDQKIVTITKSLTSLESDLEDFSFFRISKSHLINMDCVIAFHRDTNQIELKGNLFLDLARRKRREFMRMMQV